VKRPLLLGAALLLASGGPALACPSCFGQAEGPLVDAARLGIWLLLAVTLGLQGAFAAFFLYLRRRARKTVDEAIDGEWSRLQREWDRTGRSA
jgi:hypothetical protein